MTDNTLARNDDGSVTLAKERQQVCLSAAWELDALAQLLPGLVPFELDMQLHYTVRGLAARVERLANVLNSGLHDTAVQLERLERDVFVGGHRDV